MTCSLDLSEIMPKQGWQLDLRVHALARAAESDVMGEIKVGWREV